MVQKRLAIPYHFAELADLVALKPLAETDGVLRTALTDDLGFTYCMHRQ